MTTRLPGKPDWSRRLSRPLDIPGVMTIATLGDVRELLWHVPNDQRRKSVWRNVAAELDKAAACADPDGVTLALRLALMLETAPVVP